MYTIKLMDWNGKITVAQLIEQILARLKEDGRFTASLEPLKGRGYSIGVQRVRLTQPKPYCGQHPGKCLVGGPRRRTRFLEWEDWVAFHSIVNDVLDDRKLVADVWSTPAETIDRGNKMWIRRGDRRRVRYGWTERPGVLGGPPTRVWNHGSDDQFDPENAE